jgi:integrase
LDSDQITELLVAARRLTPERYSEIACLALTGMRAGELYALKWDCVDLERRRIVVKRSISNGVLTETTKTKSQRVVPIHPALADVLKQHREQQVEHKIHIVRRSELVFPSDRGTPRTANTLDKAFDLLGVALKTDIRIGSQVLRRSMNTNLVQYGVDRLTLRAIMGHTSEQMTARYFGVNHDSKADAVENMVTVVPLPELDDNV